MKYSPDCPATVREIDTLDTVLRNFETHHNQSFSVVSSDNEELIGIITLEHLKETLALNEMADCLLAVDIMERPLCTCSPDDSLPDVYKKFTESDTETMPIVDEKMHSYGVMEKFAADHYLHTKIIELNHKLESMG